MKLITLAALVLSTTASANAFSVEVGQTKVMGVSQRVVGITIQNPTVVEVKKLQNGGGVTLAGKELGKTKISLRTVDGTDVDFVLHVTSAGARVFDVSRDEPAPAPAPAKPARKYAKAAKADDAKPAEAPTQVADAVAVP